METSLAYKPPRGISFYIPADKWEFRGPLHAEAQVLYTPVCINNQVFHAYAYGVHKQAGRLRALDTEWNDALEHVRAIDDVQLIETQPITIDGVTRDYVIVIYPNGE